VSTVVYSSPFVPAEWIAAHGLRPLRLRPGAGAASLGPVMGMCPYARAFVGDVASGAAAPAGTVLTTTCDQMRRAAEWLALGGGPPVFLMNVPATWQTPASARLYRDELQRLGRFLVRLGGAAPSREHLADTMEAYDARRTALRGALGALGAREASEAIARFDAGEDLESGKPCGTAALGCAGLHRSCTPEGRRATVPLALVGGPLAREDARVFDAIERAGGRVVLDGTESGARTLPAPFDRRRLRDDPLLELVDAYFGAIPDIFRRPDTALYQWLGRELAASAARGIVVWRNVWCDLWAASVVRLREATGLAVLDLDVSGEEAGFNRTADRLQALMEMLK
jgi:benzoyl-CoA reductase/2-hydroxyglutaryl-CoA dehydratase subunit BcrC/BadD/HgdB